MNLRIKPLQAALMLAGFAPLAAQAFTAPVAADSYTQSNSAGTNYGTSAGLKIAATLTATNKALMRFDLSGLPAGITSTEIAKATLVLFPSAAATAGALQISPLSGAWTETGVNYGNIPGAGTALTTNLAAPLNSYATLEVTDLVKNWIDNPGSNNGLLIEPATNGMSLVLDSKESIGTGHAAYIEIALSGSGNSLSIGTVTTGAAGSPAAASITGTAPNQILNLTIPQGIAGTPGAPGADGRTVLNGSGAPSLVLGAAGDFYIDTGSYTMYGPKSGAGWGGGTSLVGPAGANGSNGTNGTSGTNGTNGVNAFTATSAQFSQPATNATVSVAVGNTAWMSVGQAVYVAGGGYYTVSSITDGTTVVLSNLGYPGNAAASAQVGATPASVSPAGIQGGGSGGSVTSVGATAPLSNTGTASAPVLAMGQASGSTSGYLSSADWTIFNSKGNGTITAVNAGTGLAGGGGSGSVTLNLANAPSSASGGNTLVLRDGSGNFSAGTITANLNGNASSATTAISAANATNATNANFASSANTANFASSAGSASTASALAANGSNCPAGQYPLGVDAQGNAEGCTAASSGGGGPAVYQAGSGTSLSNVKINIGTIAPAGTLGAEATQTFGSAFTGTPFCTATLRQGALQADNASNSNTPGVKITTLTTTTIGVALSLVPNGTNGGTITPLIHFHCIGT